MTTTRDDQPAGLWEQASAHAGNYERDLVPAVFDPWGRELVELADLRAGERVLDLACGTGVVARLAAPRVGETGAVHGVDVNADMLEVARQVSAGTRPPVEWRQARAEDTGLPDAAFDVVFCQQGLQFFPDRPAAVRELRRVLVPGGRVAVSTWFDLERSPWGSFVGPFVGPFERHLAHIPEAVGFLRAIFGLGDAGELHDLLTAAGFTDVRVTRETRTVRLASAEAWTESFLGAAPIPGIGTLSGPARQQLVTEAVEALRPYLDGAGLALPASANVALARA